MSATVLLRRQQYAPEFFQDQFGSLQGTYISYIYVDFHILNLHYFYSSSNVDWYNNDKVKKSN